MLTILSAGCPNPQSPVKSGMNMPSHDAPNQATIDSIKKAKSHKTTNGGSGSNNNNH